jgi:pre-60S factor REI1
METKAAVLSCNACNKEFEDSSEQKLHYKSEWHRYNLKRKVSGVPGVTEALFMARQAAIAAEKNKLNETPMLYSCALCNKGYRSSKAHAQHLTSRSHILRTSNGDEETAIIKPLALKKPAQQVPPVDEVSDESDEWTEVDEDDDNDTNVVVDDDDDELEQEWDASCCFMCDKENRSIESCMVHMHKQHGFFIPDVEYLKDPRGLLTYLGLKVKRDLICLYCNDRCLPFSSLEAVRKHMVAKSHCKVHYGDGGDEEEAELEEFYDYSSSYMDEDGEQMVASDDVSNGVELGSGGSELIISRRSENGKTVKALGSREYLRYYKQKPRPTPENDIALTLALAARYRSMGLATVQSRKNAVRMKVLREMNRSGVEAMRSKMGMKSNVIRNLPKNCTY